MQMLETTETDERFQALCRELDEEYFQLFGEQSLKYKGVNQIEEWFWQWKGRLPSGAAVSGAAKAIRLKSSAYW